MTWIVNENSFQNWKFHGNTTWRVCDLSILTVLLVWSDHATLTGAFAEAHGWSRKMLGRAALGSYQGLTGVLVAVTGTLLRERMHGVMERHGGDYWRVGGWLPLAVDGSRVSTPRTASNERAFCAANDGRSVSTKQRAQQRRKNRVPQRKKKSQPVKPQIWLTLVWHMGLRLLWCWRTGPSNSSERAHFQELLKTERFPEKTLFCSDAGFVGYDFRRSIVDQGQHFLMRVGSNVTLLKNLGDARESHGIFYCWPTKAARQNQPPLVLRLITLKFGRTPIDLVTSVLNPQELSGDTARQMYQLRWGIELQFHKIKQTFGRSKLRSKTPERALRELDWSLLGLWMIPLFAVDDPVVRGKGAARNRTTAHAQQRGLGDPRHPRRVPFVVGDSGQWDQLEIQTASCRHRPRRTHQEIQTSPLPTRQQRQTPRRKTQHPHRHTTTQTPTPLDARDVKLLNGVARRGDRNHA